MALSDLATRREERRRFDVSNLDIAPPTSLATVSNCTVWLLSEGSYTFMSDVSARGLSARVLILWTKGVNVPRTNQTVPVASVYSWRDDPKVAKRAGVAFIKKRFYRGIVFSFPGFTPSLVVSSWSLHCSTLSQIS